MIKKKIKKGRREKRKGNAEVGKKRKCKYLAGFTTG
jgi:hypothetical protein